ncbi:hypothetical protein PIB30_048547 [Stylosanthes scabra]|uniref:F-box domain-containing protein n=1 Tax=Stylosanthes scabra TaxID=79078 RepID=A0ABU6RH21_9FABA|nr:hypothetical protein [Stylosanthes scabra]
MCLEIFKRCDPKTLHNVRATSHYWRETLSSYEFVSEVSTCWRRKLCSLISHFGFNNKLSSSFDWVMNMDPVNGEANKLHLPMLTPSNGWFRIVGVENGIFCFRFCSTRDRSYLLAWNHAVGSTKMIPNPPKHYCTKCSFLYTFAYFPNSEINNVGETPSWNKLFKYDGYGHPYLPALFLDGDVIQVLEQYYQTLLLSFQVSSPSDLHQTTSDEMQAHEVQQVLNLPDELIMEVLIRSNHQTMCRCRLLSRGWNIKLQSYEFLSKHYQRWSRPQSSVFIHIYFPQWTTDPNSFLRVSLKQGKVLTLPSMSSFYPGEIVKVHGIVNGNMCLSLKLSRTCERLAVWNMFSEKTKEIPALPAFSCKTLRDQFAFTYFPNSIYYCIIHTFKCPLTLEPQHIYYCKSDKWTRTIGCEGCVGNIHADYVSSEGVVYWLNFQPQQHHIPNSIVACSVVMKGINVYTIPDKCKSRMHSLVILDN